MKQLSYLAVERLERIKPKLIEIDGVKYIQLSESNRRIIRSNWEGQLAQLQIVCELLVAEIKQHNNPSSKTTLLHFRQRILALRDQLYSRVFTVQDII